MHVRKKVILSAWIDEGIKKKLQEMAKQQDRSLSYIMQKILSKGVAHLGGNDGQPA